MSVRRLAPKHQQPANFMFTAENLAWTKQQIAKFPPGRQASAVIPILWRAQEQHDGWVSEAAIRAVADLLEMPYIRALEIATFYTMFQLQPVGRKAHIQVCGTTPCRLRGAEHLIEACRQRIHHDPFHLSEDGNFSWEEVECLGACVNAPMVLIWNDTYEDLTEESFAKVLDGFAAGKPPKPGPQNGRQFSAPEGGPTTLTNGGSEAKNTAGAPKGPVLTDAESKKPGAAANVHERPAPKPPGDDATRKDPP
ncbi:NADH-quinone oxidoreductase subunit NuoE [uncultured Bradyrhizobium sp.]|uniref:NADH-quinone oxidoreductase subunit NuoE n=1 Tax=uncultured Bradyrhizobium sp. TaxID=199684 RepID=UPI0035C9D23A